MPALLPLDLRDPHAPMVQRPIRLPQCLAEQLAQQAEALRTTPAALSRTLLHRGSAELAAALDSSRN